MILSFQERFIEKIVNKTKIHTIRSDSKGRWKKDMNIHFWKGNPRNPTQNPYQFASGIVESVHTIFINPFLSSVEIWNKEEMIRQIWKENELNQFAINDGFNNWNELIEFFPTTFEGKIITWNSDIEVIFRSFEKYANR